MYKNIFRTPLILGTIFYIIALICIFSTENNDLEWYEIILIWPLLTLIILLLRLMTIAKEKSYEAGEKFGKKMTEKLFKK